MIVVDLGCHTHAHRPDEDSVRRLVERFHPHVLFGFDPHPDMNAGVTCLYSTTVLLTRVAAHPWDGMVGYVQDGLASRTTALDEPHDLDVMSFNLPEWLALLPPDDLVVKMDIEGAEHRLLTALHDHDLDKRITLLLIEWHCSPDDPSRQRLEASLRCPIELW